MPNQLTGNVNRTFVLLTTFLLVVFVMSADAWGQATSITSLGYRANEGGGGAITAEWTTGNLGNTWAEGEWVPYQLKIENVQTDFPNLDGFPDILMSYDFTSQDNRFVDLVRSIQAGTTPLVDGQGWVNDAGTAYPDVTRPQIEDAQNDIGNIAPLENEWTGFGLLNLPNSQINRGPDGVSQGTPTDAEHTFRITKADLLAAGIPTSANTIIIYYQLHESRSFVWANSLQSQYDQSPTDDWGGYLYSLGAFPADQRNGSGYVPGSSGHIEVEFNGGAKTVPIPIPERLPGIVSGLKWHDANGNGIIDGGEETLSGWRIYVSGTLEGINFATSTITDELGNYSFPNLTSNVVWSVVEDAQRYNPSTDGWMQTYPQPGTVVGVGTGYDFGYTGDTAAYGWHVALTNEFFEQGDMNFGNKLCAIEISCPPQDTIECDESDDPANTGTPTVTANCPPYDTDYSDNIVNGDCDIDGYLYYIERTWIATDAMGKADTCVQLIYVIDTTDPIITGVGPDDTIECPNTPVFSTPSASDNCSEPSLTYEDVTTPGACPNEYSVTRTWTATDDCGNTAMASQTITVEDNTPPVISGVGADGSVECPNEPVFSEPTANDACGWAGITYSDQTTPGNCPNEYSVTRTWTATDSCGNTSMASQTISVEDNTPPVISGVGADGSVECPNEPVFSEPTATDACGWAGLTYEDQTTPGNCPQEYSVTRTWTATDSCGNTSQDSQTINVTDNTPPVITCPSDVDFSCESIGVFGEATAVDACDPEPIIDYSDDTTSTTCPLEITRTWTATDHCGNQSSCDQMIVIRDDTPPMITGVGANTTIECPNEPQFSEPTATDNCGQPSLEYDDETTPGACPNEYSITRTWTATDACGNTAMASQTITVEDNTPPVISGVGDDATIDCPAEPQFSDPSANDACGWAGLSYEDETTPGDCPAEYSVTRTWTAVDSCGNSATASQTINVQDTVGPTIECAADEHIGCEDEVVFTPPSAYDACDNDPSIIMVGTDTTAGPGDGEVTYTRYWYAVDACENASDTCGQSIIRETCPEGCTFTIGGWGSDCPESQVDDPYSTQPGCVRDHYFDQVFPEGVTIGHNSGKQATWTSSAAVAAFLPNGGTPGTLEEDYTDPTLTSAGILASQILALTLNREYSCAGVFYDLGVSPSAACYGDDIISEECGGPFAGLTVDEFLDIANKAVAGKINILNGFGASLSDVNYTATCLNELHDECDPSAAQPIYGSFGKEEALPSDFTLNQNYPNPFNPSTVFSFALPNATHVRLEIFNVMGQKIATVVDGPMSAGSHEVTFDFSANASGVYLYRLSADSFVETKKMILLK